MAGLLDSLTNALDGEGMDANGKAALNQGLLTMGLSMLASPGRFGQQLGQGGLQGMQAYQGAQQLQRQNAVQDLQKQHMQMQMDEAKRKAEQESAQRAWLQNLPDPQFNAGAQAMANGAGPTVANAARVPAVDPVQRLLYEGAKSGAVPFGTYVQSLQKDDAPIPLADGGMLVTRNGRVLAANPKDNADKLPSAVQEYQFAKAQGYGGTFEQWVLTKAQASAQTISMGSPTVVTDPRTGQQLVVQPGNRPGSPAIPITLPGGTFAAPGEQGGKIAENRASLKDATDSINLIEQARQLIPKSSNGLVRQMWNTGVGMAGISTDAAKADAQLAAIGGMLVSKMPKMSGPQSDADVKNYKEMAGKVADTKLPTETRLAALEAVAEIQRRYASDASAAIANQYAPIGQPRPQKPTPTSRVVDFNSLK